MSLRAHQIIWTIIAAIAPFFIAWLGGYDFPGREPKLAACFGASGMFGFAFYYCPVWFKIK